MSRWSENDPELHELAEEWARSIRKGDVVRTPGGDLRIVRSVECNPERRGKGCYKMTLARRTHCTFAIRRCSWTGRPYTGYSVAEMVSQGWTPTSAKPRALNGEIDVRLEKDFGADKCDLTCCAVRGLP